MLTHIYRMPHNIKSFIFLRKALLSVGDDCFFHCFFHIGLFVLCKIIRSGLERLETKVSKSCKIFIDPIYHLEYSLSVTNVHIKIYPRCRKIYE